MPVAQVALSIANQNVRVNTQKWRVIAIPHKMKLCDATLFPKSCVRWAERAGRRRVARAEKLEWQLSRQSNEKNLRRKQHKHAGPRPRRKTRSPKVQAISESGFLN